MLLGPKQKATLPPIQLIIISSCILTGNYTCLCSVSYVVCVCIHEGLWVVVCFGYGFSVDPKSSCVGSFTLSVRVVGTGKRRVEGSNWVTWEAVLRGDRGSSQGNLANSCKMTVIRLVKCLHEDLNFIPRAHVRRCYRHEPYNPNSEELEAGRPLGFTAQLA